jgi:hypothetical protein
MINNPAKNPNSDKEVIHFDRGFESLIRRIDIYDMNGNLLEAIDHYNCLYAITELCTSEPETRMSRGRFTMECLQPSNYASGTDVWPDQHFQTLSTVQSGGQQNEAPRTYEICFNLISGVFGGTCEKYWPLKAINGLRIQMQLENPQDAFVYRFLPGAAAILSERTYRTRYRQRTSMLQREDLQRASYPPQDTKPTDNATSPDTDYTTASQAWTAYGAGLAELLAEYARKPISISRPTRWN